MLFTILNLIKYFLSVSIPIFLIINYNIYPLSTVFTRVFIVYAIVVIIFINRIEGIEESKNRKNLLLKIIYLIFIILSFLIIIFSYYKLEEFMFYLGFGTPTYQVYTAFIGILLLLEATRIIAGLVIPAMAVSFIFYAFYRGYDYLRIITEVFSYEGIFGIAISVVISVVFIFLLLGNLLQEANFGDFLLNIGKTLVGGTVGGPAKIAVISSGLFGSISGSAVANVAGTGTFTIPMMKKLGFKPEIAAAVEASASTGGQIMPPVLAAAAFLIAEIIQVPYIEVAKAALLPAIAFYISIFVSVDAYAKLQNLKGIPKKERPTLKESFKSGGHLGLTLLFLIYLLAVRMQPLRAAFFTLIFLLPLSYLMKNTRLTGKKILKSLEGTTKNLLVIVSCGAVIGIILAMIGLTGFGAKLAYFILSTAGMNKLIILFFTMVTCLIFGMALTTTISYLVLISVLGVTLNRLGVVPMGAHLFVLYFAALSGITPPVAMAAFTAATIAHTNFMSTALQSCKLSLVAFIVPYIFVYAPSMILQGNSPGILHIIFLYLIVIPFSLSWALWGHTIWRKINFIERTLHFLTAIVIFSLLVKQFISLQVIVGILWIIFVVIEHVSRNTYTKKYQELIFFLKINKKDKEKMLLI